MKESNEARKGTVLEKMLDEKERQPANRMKGASHYAASSTRRARAAQAGFFTKCACLKAPAAYYRIGVKLSPAFMRVSSEGEFRRRPNGVLGGSRRSAGTGRCKLEQRAVGRCKEKCHEGEEAGRKSANTKGLDKANKKRNNNSASR